MDHKIFHNRTHAGAMLAWHLRQYHKRPQTMVVGLARGGVIVAAEVAMRLHLPMDVFISRKISTPERRKSSLAAVTESGVIYVDEGSICAEPWLYRELMRYLENEIQLEKHEVARRCKDYRKGRPFSIVNGLTVIVVDEGAFNGATFLAAVDALRKLGAQRIVAALPVAPEETLERIRLKTDDLVALARPDHLRDLDDFYTDFSGVTDEQVVQCLAQCGCVPAAA